MGIGAIFGTVNTMPLSRRECGNYDAAGLGFGGGPSSCP